MNNVINKIISVVRIVIKPMKKLRQTRYERDMTYKIVKLTKNNEHWMDLEQFETSRYSKLIKETTMNISSTKGWEQLALVRYSHELKTNGHRNA